MGVNDTHDTQLQQKRAARRQQQSGDTPSEKRKVVMDGAHLKCPYAAGPGKLVVDSNSIKLQDMLWATEADRNNMINLQFEGNCSHPNFSGQTPPPCKSVIFLGKWQKIGTTKVQGNTVLIKDSCITCNPKPNTAAPKAAQAGAAPPKNEKVLVEENIVRKGYWIQENGKTIIVNSRGVRGYDSVYADAPSEETMRQNGMSQYDIFNINLTKSYTAGYLESELRTTLWSFSDIEDGFGENGVKLARHFFDGNGVPFIFGNDSNPAREIKDSAEFKSFVKALQNELKLRYVQHHYINESATAVYQFNSRLPYYSALRGFDYRVNEAATFVGGIQGCIARYKLYKYSLSGEIVVEITHVTFLDTFGAGWEDGGAGGVVKQWIPGLVAMFCLQHFKNKDNKEKYQPFTLNIDIELEPAPV